MRSQSSPSRPIHGTLLVSDPWEFGTQHGVVPIPVTLERLPERYVLVTMQAALEFLGTRFRHLVGVPRYLGDSVGNIWRWRPVGLDLVPIPAEPESPDYAVRQADEWRAWHLTGVARRQES